MLDAVTVLQNAGWDPERRENVSSDLAALESDRYEVRPEVIRFLESFTRLTIRYQSGAMTGDVRPDSVWFDAEKATRETRKVLVDRCVEEVGVRLAPVGYANSDHLLIMLAEVGRFFGEYGDFFGNGWTAMAEDPWAITTSYD